jgi:LacI family transcriptional regulator
MGKISAQLILDHAAKKKDDDLTDIKMLNTELIIRESSLRKNKKMNSLFSENEKAEEEK